MLPDLVSSGSHFLHFLVLWESGVRMNAIKCKVLEFPWWRDGISGVSAASGHRFHPGLTRWIKDLVLLQIWCNCSLDRSLAWELHVLRGGQKRKKEKEKKKVLGIEPILNE